MGYKTEFPIVKSAREFIFLKICLFDDDDELEFNDASTLLGH